MFTHLPNLLLDPRLAHVHATFDAGDGPAAWANNQDDDLTLADLAAADEWSAETTEGAVLIVAKTGPDCYEIDIAHAGFCVQRCYACGRLYPDIRFRVGWLLSQGPYDPTDYDCGCTDRLDEPAASPGGWRVWRLGDDSMHADPCDNDCDLYRELDASIRQATAASSWRTWN